jgi:hypothetical protein
VIRGHHRAYLSADPIDQIRDFGLKRERNRRKDVRIRDEHLDPPLLKTLQPAPVVHSEGGPG